MYFDVVRFECSDCHLAWLIRDNRHLLPVILSGVDYTTPTCTNVTYFHLLNPNGYADCPVFIPQTLSTSYSTLSTTSSTNTIVTTTTVSSSTYPSTTTSYPTTSFVCPGPDGYFADPLSCSSYYLCLDNTPYFEVYLYFL